MRQTLIRMFLILALLGGFALIVVPPKEKLRLGKDLQGGVTMVYAVQVRENEDAQAILARTIDALRRRVDPNGLMDMQWVPQGRDRIEITMPLPSDEVKQRRRAFEDELVKLGRASLNQTRLQQLVTLEPEPREARIRELAAGSDSRLAKIRAVVENAETARARRAAYGAAEPAAKEAMIDAVAESEEAYDAALKAALEGALSGEDLRAALRLSPKPRTVGFGKERFTLPSPREEAIAKLKDRNKDEAAEIDRLVAMYADIEAKSRTFDDPQDLIRLMRGAGVLSFRITVDAQGNSAHPEEDRLRREFRELGPRNVRSTDARWFRINQVETWVQNKEQYDFVKSSPDAASAFFDSRGYVVEVWEDAPYMLCWDTRALRLTPLEGNWAVSSAYETADQLGRPAIGFQMDPRGAVLLGDLTRSNVNNRMAVLLDDEVYTAPNLQEAISTRGIIQGEFSPAEIQYVVRVLGGGALTAKVSTNPISINAVGPELGIDNLRMGMESAVLSAIIVVGFMIAYYFGCGLIAVAMTLVNALVIVAFMAITRTPFTMPGIAGLILTFGMAVDSAVLIFERMREEFGRGADLKTAVRLGFDKATSAIIDGNLTNLIVCIVLYYTTTPEIKGFAITMGLGVLANLFATMVFGRVLFSTLLLAGWRKARMLPMVVPQLQKVLTPRINWLQLRAIFFTISIIGVGIGIGMIGTRGKKMLDNEFLGGTQVTLEFRTGESGNPVTLTRSQVQERVVAIASRVQEGAELQQLRNAEVVPINPADDGVTSSTFMIKSLAQNAEAVTTAILAEFQDVIDIRPPLAFVDSQDAPDTAPLYTLEKKFLGDNIGRPGLLRDVTEYRGGVAVVLSSIQPAPTVSELRTRLERRRETAEFSDTLSRKREIIILEGDESAVRSAVIVVADESVSSFENEQRWASELRNREWKLVGEALTRASTPASVHNFSSTIARSFQANAITAMILSVFFIGLYIWVRFKTPLFGLAALVSLLHDVLAVIGLIALAEILYEHPATEGFARSIGLLPFKIDMNMLAALLTIAGYSLNDTVVIMDRIRENKGKLPHAGGDIINLSINQTFSRTLITGGTTMGSCIILYLYGGEGMRAFAFALFTGLVIGTYSSVAVAAPIVWSKKYDRELAKLAAQR